jgi:hypothetical protein
MQVKSAFNLRFLLFDGNAICVGPSVLTDAGHLPGDLGPRLSAGNFEMISGDFFGDI